MQRLLVSLVSSLVFRKTVISVVLGLCGFFSSFLALNYTRDAFTISILWSYAFPLLAALAYGWRYGLIAGTLGLGAFFTFFLWPTNGWGNHLATLLYIIMFVWHGYCADRRLEKSVFWNHPLIANVPFSLMFVAAICLLYPVIFPLNAGIWAHAETSIPVSVVHSIATKEIITLFLILPLDMAVLKISTVRRLLGLVVEPESKNNGRIFVSSLAGSLLCWGVLFVFDRIFLGNDVSSYISAGEVIALIVLIYAGAFVSLLLSGYTESLLRSEERERRQNEHLMKSEKLASLGTLAAGIAHEINNPNMFIMLNASTLKDDVKGLIASVERCPERHRLRGGLSVDDLKTDTESAFGHILEGSERIKRIVEELKEFVKDKPSTLDEQVDVNRVIEAAITITRNRVKNSTDSFEFVKGDGLPAVPGNSQKIEQVVINLIINACDALADKSRSIVITSLYDDQASMVRFSVRDEGEGMTPDILKRIKDPFFTTKRDSGGTGLGVAISARVIEEHGGSMDYVSAPGAGTTVTVSLPTVRPSKSA